MVSFEQLELLPPDPIFGLVSTFKADSRKEKVNLSVGAYRDDDGQPYLFNVVQQAEKKLIEQQNNKEYLPIDGNQEFLMHAVGLVFNCEYTYSTQTVGGTSALRIGGEFLKQSGIDTIFIPNPSWANHQPTFQRSGLKIGHYNYPIDHLEHIPSNSAILLHGCCHNPTGIDPTFEQWKELSDFLKIKQITPFFDLAYQGLGKNFEEDSAAIRYFSEQGHNMLVAYSFSKNMGLYGERVGWLATTTDSKASMDIVASHLKKIIRSEYSNPPLHGAKIAQIVLSSMKQEWENELTLIRNRILEMRTLLSQKVTPLSFLKEQNGFFSITGLTPDQVNQLREEHAIYMTLDGRINIAGINKHNIDYIAEAINKILK